MISTESWEFWNNNLNIIDRLHLHYILNYSGKLKKGLYIYKST